LRSELAQGTIRLLLTHTGSAVMGKIQRVLEHWALIDVEASGPERWTGRWCLYRTESEAGTASPRDAIVAGTTSEVSFRDLALFQADNAAHRAALALFDTADLPQ